MQARKHGCPSIVAAASSRRLSRRIASTRRAVLALER